MYTKIQACTHEHICTQHTMMYISYNHIHSIQACTQHIITYTSHNLVHNIQSRTHQHASRTHKHTITYTTIQSSTQHTIMYTSAYKHVHIQSRVHHTNHVCTHQHTLLYKGVDRLSPVICGRWRWWVRRPCIDK